MYLSLERLYHFRCGSCNKWWSIGDADVTKTVWYCAWCGEKQHKNLSSPDYPKQAPAKSEEPKVCINFFEGDFALLQPTSPHAVMIDEHLFPTCEHAYQARKFTQPYIIEEIKNAQSPNEAQGLALRHKDERVVDWTEIKITAMEDILREKARQYPEVRELLKKSGNAFLGEVSPTDHFWATGNNGEGENWLGRIWMKIRDESTQNEKTGQRESLVRSS